MQLNNQAIKDNILQSSTQIRVISIDIDAIDMLPMAAKLSVAPVLYFSTPKQHIEYLAIGQWSINNNQDARSLLQSTDAPFVCLGSMPLMPTIQV